MKRRIWKRYVYLSIVGLAVYMAKSNTQGDKTGYVPVEQVQAFAMENEQEEIDLLLLQMENENRATFQGEGAAADETHPSAGETELRAADEMGKQQIAGQTKQQDLPPPESGERNATAFLPHEKQFEYDWESLKEYKNLIATFYAIDAGTAGNENQLNVEALTSKDMTIDKNLGPYQILIYHSHSQEAFADSKAGDVSDTIVGMGQRLSEILTEQYGYGVLHHTAEYDTFRDDAYAVALPEIEKLLAENPSIQVVIDLHRDAGVEGVSRTTVMDGKEYAKFMLFNGMSYHRKTGNIGYLENPNLADNLAFSFQMQVKAGEYYPGLTRKIYLKAYRYNMHLKPKTLLIELGDSNNTVEQVRNTLDPLAHILHMVLSGD